MVAEIPEPAEQIRSRTGSEDSANHDVLTTDAPDLDALQKRIMVEIQGKLSQKEESLWRRGQVEIKRLQIQQQEVTGMVSMMQERQEALVKENQAIRVALMEVTSKFEQVVKQMREVLRALPHAQQAQIQQEEQLASGVELTPSSGPQTAAGWSAEVHMPVTMWHGQGLTHGSTDCGSLDALGAKCNDSGTNSFRTPPRGAAALPGDGLPIPVSLASAISSSTTMPPLPSPSSGVAQRLHLADWLPDQASVNKREVLAQTPPRKTPSTSDAPMTDATCATLPIQPSQKQITIEVVKEPGCTTLGIDVNQEGGSLRVEHIDDLGLIGRLNASQETNGTSSKVCCGDFIVEVNGVRGDANRMLHECKVSQRLTLTIEKQLQSTEVKVESTDAEACQMSPASTKLRPDAQVFVPSARKESQISADECATGPPGLECHEANSSTASACSPLSNTPQLSQAFYKTLSSSLRAFGRMCWRWVRSPSQPLPRLLAKQATFPRSSGRFSTERAMLRGGRDYQPMQ
eukprot:TRINITY_DN8166_c0_g1_i2.p1 TRINITY_DN8166_c0_g1~~TRINITY_DN8166_c0_g1_i2.p1  ORF type:complete len:532 (-),score=84.53 TRINITY_DN8166_c0_g1_i2:353-1903(-)